MRTLWLQNCLELAERGQVPASSFNPWPTSPRSHMCISTACCCPAPSGRGLVLPTSLPPSAHLFWPPIKRLWSRAVGQFWLSGLSVRFEGCRLELKRLVAYSTISRRPRLLPLHSPSFSARFLFFFSPTLVCRQFCAVFTRVSQPVRNGLSSGERRLLENRTHTHTLEKASALAYRLPRQGPLDLCFDGGPLQPPPTKVQGRCLLVSRTDYRPNCASCIHPSNEGRVQWAPRISFPKNIHFITDSYYKRYKSYDLYFKNCKIYPKTL